MHTKSMTRILAAVVVAFGLSAGAKASSTELTISSWLPPTHPINTDMFAPWADEVAKATDNRVTLRMLPTAVASPREHFDAIRNGLADVTIIVPGYTSGRFHLTKIVEFPFFNTTAEASSVAFWRVYEQELAKADEHRGVKVLSVFSQGAAQLFTRDRPVSTIDDMAGVKVRTGGEMAGLIAQSLGMTPLQRPVGEVYEMLTRGVADGVIVVPETLLSFNLLPAINHGTLLPGGFYGGSFSLIMNEEKFNSLSEQDREKIMQVSGENFARMAGQVWDHVNEEGLQAAREQGVPLVEADAALVEAVRQRTAAMVDEWISGANAKGVDGAKAMDLLRAEVKALTN